MTFVQDSKTSSTLTQENRTAVGTLTQDNKASSTMTADNRTAVGTLTQDSKTTGGYLWASTMYPWQMEYPWLWEGNGSLLTSDIRTV